MREKDELGACEYRANNDTDDPNGHQVETLLVIKFPNSRVLRIISRSFFLAMIVLALLPISSIIGGFSDAPPYNTYSDLGVGFKILPILLHDLMDNGLIRQGHKGFVLARPGDIEGDSEIVREIGIDLLPGTDLKRKAGEHYQAFDFVFAPSPRKIHLVDGILKDGGLVISLLGADPSDELRLPRNFKIIYIRRFENTVVAMQKAGASSNGAEDAPTKQVFCRVTPEKKKAALEGLEDVYLEPPRRTTFAEKSRFASRKIKFLPDLLKDSLDEYPRRIFISDDSRVLDWFYKNYPTRDQEFEVYHVKEGVRPEESSLSSWMVGKVGVEDYVVMKAEAQVVEEMLNEGSLCLVDELFLECKNQWVDGEEENGSKRAYWQCLSLYGKVRDVGIAVHQWWN